jgi:hypothetical protein
MMLRILPLALLVLAVSVAQADSQITIKVKHGGVSLISTNGEKVRMEDQGDPSYVIGDYLSGQFSSVDPERKQVMLIDMNAMPESTSATDTSNPVTISLDKKGKGPKIAGYKTKEIVLNANGQYCGTVFGSKKVLKKKGISELFEFMNRMRQQSMKMMGAYRATRDVCEQAMGDLSLSFKKTGAPLRMLNAQGQIESEVTKIKTDKKIDPGYYEYPSDYTVVSVSDQINAASQQNQQMMEQMGQNMPNMEELMQQMQSQGGEVPPEAMEQLKKMQEMFKQYQQE